MPGKGLQLPTTYPRSLRAVSRHNGHQTHLAKFPKTISNLSPLRSSDDLNTRKQRETKPIAHDAKEPHESTVEPGAMSRRLAAATEDALLEGGRAGRKAVEEAGFSEELKDKLLQKLQAATFRSDNASAIADAGLTSNIGKGSREMATGQAWAGMETTGDTVLRMLDDARKPLKPGLRAAAKIPSPFVDVRLKRQPTVKPGQRLANAREKTSIYAMSKDVQMTETERDDMRRELKERFTPAARAMPNSIRGLAALANERIEDAIARGQFKNIPRGKAIERDSRADNPFLDTTEYIMNKMIQRQDIVPPWIEKQQELVKTANVFRARLRNDWKRQAARTIASRGGSLFEQMRIAERYAESERTYNPRRGASQQPASTLNNSPNTPEVKLTEDAIQTVAQPDSTKNGTDTAVATEQENSAVDGSAVSASTDATEQPQPLPALFRIPSWEAAELSYLKLAITNLNNITRSYNLMAPDLAKKPYFSLERELRACYADVAPQLAGAIQERSLRPARELVEKVGHKEGGVLERFASDKAKIYDSKRPLYGFKEFWNDLWGEKPA